MYRGGFCRIKETKYHSVSEKGKKEDPENARSGIRTSVTKVMEQLILETTSTERTRRWFGVINIDLQGVNPA